MIVDSWFVFTIKRSVDASCVGCGIPLEAIAGAVYVATHLAPDLEPALLCDECAPVDALAAAVVRRDVQRLARPKS